MNRSYVQPRFRCTGQGFIVLAQPATTSQPRQCSLNHPPAWQHRSRACRPLVMMDVSEATSTPQPGLKQSPGFRHLAAMLIAHISQISPVGAS